MLSVYIFLGHVYLPCCAPDKIFRRNFHSHWFLPLYYLVFEETAGNNRSVCKCCFDFVRTEKAELQTQRGGRGHLPPHSWFGLGLGDGLVSFPHHLLFLFLRSDNRGLLGMCQNLNWTFSPSSSQLWLSIRIPWGVFSIPVERLHPLGFWLNWFGVRSGH